MRNTITTTDTTKNLLTFKETIFSYTNDLIEYAEPKETLQIVNNLFYASIGISVLENSHIIFTAKEIKALKTLMNFLLMLDDDFEKDQILNEIESIYQKTNGFNDITSALMNITFFVVKSKWNALDFKKSNISNIELLTDFFKDLQRIFSYEERRIRHKKTKTKDQKQKAKI